jgi:hypothetical protein
MKQLRWLCHTGCYEDERHIRHEDSHQLYFKFILQIRLLHNINRDCCDTEAKVLGSCPEGVWYKSSLYEISLQAVPRPSAGKIQHLFQLGGVIKC